MIRPDRSHRHRSDAIHKRSADQTLSINVHTVDRQRRANNLAALSLVALFDAQAGRHATGVLLANVTLPLFNPSLGEAIKARLEDLVRSQTSVERERERAKKSS